MKIRIALSLPLCSLLLAASPDVVLGQSGPPAPGKPPRLITTYPPGGASDLMARIVGQKLGELWGQVVVVENRSGGNGSIGLEYAARQPPDGSSFVIGNMGPVTINPLISKVQYDMAKDFAPVSMVASGPTVLVTNPATPARTLKELIQLAREKPRTINFGTAGPGTLGHLGGEMMKRLANIDITHVPYKGGILAINDLLGNHVQLVFADPQPILQHLQTGKARPLAVTSAKRSSAVPDVPTFAEAGLPGFVAENWWGMWLPAGAPRAVVERLQADMTRALGSADVKSKFENMGVDPLPSTPEALREFTRSEIEKWGRLVKEADIRSE